MDNENASTKTSILFVCHGNICRSPMAEFVMKRLVRDSGVEEKFWIESAAVSTEEIGNPVYPPVYRLLLRHGIDSSGKRARQITVRDLETFDYIVLMDENNFRYLRPMLSKGMDSWDPQPEHRRFKKISLLMDYTETPHGIADPWYTRDFEATFDDVNLGCSEFLKRMLTGRKLP